MIVENKPDDYLMMISKILFENIKHFKEQHYETLHTTYRTNQEIMQHISIIQHFTREGLRDLLDLVGIPLVS